MHTEFDKITDRLKGLAHNGGSIEAAQVKLIGLDEIRQAAGSRWPRMRERVRSGSLEILAQHAGPDDVIIPAGDGFLIVLAETAPGQTQRRCQVMRDALLTFYLGEEALKSLRAEVSNRVLSADGLSDLIAANVRRPETTDTQRLVAKTFGAEIAHVRLFSAHERKVAARFCAPTISERGIRRIAYNPDFILDGAHSKADFLDLDIAILDEALRAAKQDKTAGGVGALGLCVHATTMQLRRARETYMSWLTDIDPEQKRHMFVSIAEIEKGTPLISIAEWTSTLRAHLPRVMLDFHYSDHAIASVGGAGAWAAGFHLPIYTGAQKGPRAQRTLDQVSFWAKSLHGQNLRLLVNGFQAPEFLQAAALQGVDLATSDALWPFSLTATNASTGPRAQAHYVN